MSSGGTRPEKNNSQKHSESLQAKHIFLSVNTCLRGGCPWAAEQPAGHWEASGAKGQTKSTGNPLNRAQPKTKRARKRQERGGLDEAKNANSAAGPGGGGLNTKMQNFSHGIDSFVGQAKA